ncbi:MAG: J domain-containing protein [Hydrogenophaga sp.]|nr:J domain-containing protein [Hydrogenophaga sp.]
MSSHHPWNELGLDGPADSRTIRRCYAALAKQHRPDTDPQGFQRLRAAYEAALQWVADEDGPAPAPPIDEPAAAAIDETDGADAGGMVEAMANPPPAIDEGPQDDWRRQVQALIDLSEARGAEAGGSGPGQEGLVALVQRVMAHPANENLNLARETEGVLVTLAARSDAWPVEAVDLVWQHYALEHRLAFSVAWHPVHQIHRRLEDARQWRQVTQMAQTDPASPEGMLFHAPTLAGRLRWWFAGAVRARSMSVIEWVRAWQPARMADLNPASVATLERMAAWIGRLPVLGPLGMLLLIAQALLWQFQVAAWWPSLGNDWPNQVWLWGVLIYLGLMAAKRWALPWLQTANARHPRTADGAELLAAGGVVLAHAVGAAAPVLWAVVGLLCGSLMLGLRALHARQVQLGRLSLGMPLFGVLMLMLLGVLPFAATAPQHFHLMWALLAIAVLQPHLPHPPLVLDERARRFLWRSDPARGFDARATCGALVLAMVAWSAVILWMGPAYDASPWAGVGALLVYAPWLLLGWLTFAGSTAQRLASGTALVLAFVVGVSLVANDGLLGRAGACQVAVALLGSAQALWTLWQSRAGRPAPAPQDVAPQAPSSWWRFWWIPLLIYGFIRLASGLAGA